MDDASLWVTPLLLLPGVGLLVMSTAIRYARIHTELHHLAEHHDDDLVEAVEALFARCRHFRNALVLLYTSAALLALAGLLGHLGTRYFEAAGMVAALTCLGILAFLLAAVELVREACRSLDVIAAHRRQLLSTREAADAGP